jgi:hypothetical protein
MASLILLAGSDFGRKQGNCSGPLGYQQKKVFDDQQDAPSLRSGA